jgi:hypothetical protein
MKDISIKFFLFLLAVSVTAFGCGGSEEGNADAPSSEYAAPTQTDKAPELSPMEIGQEIAGLYEKTMKEVTNLLQEKPAVAEVQTQVETLKEECVQKMVELGKLREALEESEKATADLQIRLKMNAVYKEPFYTTYNDIQQHYFQDKEFHKTVMSFNIISQYANFDLLKKQEPEEAQRLGIR